jgi:hypothetical protein
LGLGDFRKGQRLHSGPLPRSEWPGPLSDKEERGVKEVPSFWFFRHHPPFVINPPVSSILLERLLLDARRDRPVLGKRVERSEQADGVRPRTF